jgi:hypothetical protein
VREPPRRVPSPGAIAMRVALGLLAAWLASCHGEPLLRVPAARDCALSDEAVNRYLHGVAGLVSNQSRSDALARHEQASVSFVLAADGTASDFRVERAGRPAAAQEVLRAAVAAAPYSPPPFDPKACLLGGRAVVSLVGYARCDDALASEYAAAVAGRIQDAVNAAEIAAPESERVALRIRIDPHGVATAITLLDAKSSEAGERVAAVARKLSPYETPADSIRECVADLPFFVWIGLPGSTRPPLRIPDR